MMAKDKKINFDPSCKPCEEKFQKEIKKLIDNVEGYTEKDHQQKKDELNETFGNNK